jgi:DNA-binding response OmpR family regulator
MSKVLIVEDDESLMTAYGLALNQAGFEVALAKSGQEALDQANASTPDVILLDLLLPNMSGVDFLQAFDLSKHTSVRVIAFSNMVSPGTIEKTKQLGVSHYLVKSEYTPTRVIELINSLLGKSNERPPSA